MKKKTLDLWPKSVGKRFRTTPLLILKQQATLLRERTHDVLLAEVKTDLVGGKLRHTFYIVTPYLQDYRFGLFSIVYDSERLYPAYIVTVNEPRKLTSERELIDELKRTFRSPETKRTIKALISGKTNPTGQGQ